MPLSAELHPENVGGETANKLTQALEAFESGLAILDLLGMHAAAGHVSYGLELTRERLHSLQNGGVLPR